MKRLFPCLAVAVLLPAVLHAAELKLAGVFADNAILQRDKPVAVWGRATPGDKVTADINGQTRSAVTGADGRWQVTLDPMSASPTPIPFRVSSGASSVALQNVLVGEVWFAAGQSNMTMPVRETRDAAAEMAAAGNPAIREFCVIQRAPFAQPRETTDRTGSWVPATPASVGSFSATGYYFARELARELQVPVGIIHASAGGIAAETLTPPDAIKDIPALRRLLDERGIGYGKDVTEEEWDRRKKAKAEYVLTMESPDTDDSAWERVSTLTTNPRDRAATWFRYHFDAAEAWTRQPSMLRIAKVAGLGPIAINGRRLHPVNNNAIDMLEYRIDPGVLRAGANTLAFCVRGYSLNDRPAEVGTFVDPADAGRQLPVPGPALRKSESEGPTPADNIGLLGNLFNGMVAPQIPYQVRGVIWYQGEANVGRPGEYRLLFPAIIRGWRELWGQPDLPFLFVQLAGFMKQADQPTPNSGWAELRDAQASALALPGTAMAVALDLGDAQQIHPKNKQEVGRRLSVAALSDVYGRKDVAASGPVFASCSVADGRMRISFSSADGGLVSRDGRPLTGFAIAGADGKYAWAEARIVDGNAVEVSSPQVPAPVRVLYAWADNPDANLASKAGLPAVPFRASVPEAVR